MNDLISKIQTELPGFSKGQKQIARYILEHYDKAAFMTASRLGVTVGVSESTVVRFATELGYNGYPHLQRALQEMIRNKLTSVQRMEVSSDRMGGRDVLRTVLHADTDMIRQTVWMHRTVSQAVLGELYNHRPTTLEPLEHCVAAELEALQGGAIIKMARLHLEFHRTLYSMAGREPVMDVLERNSGDLYRLLRMMESADLWRYVAEQHSTVVQGLAMRDYEMAAHALEAEFDLVKPLLEECRYQRPYFFE